MTTPESPAAGTAAAADGAELAAALESSGVAGRIITPVHDVYRKARMLSEGRPSALMGLRHLLPVEMSEVMDALARLSGRPFPREGNTDDLSWVQPELVVEQAVKAGARLAQACVRGEKVLFGTGHPAGPIDLYMRLAKAMTLRGAEVLEFAEAEPFEMDEGLRRHHIRYVGRVACVCSGGDLVHCHQARPMEYLLDTGPHPDLVVGDHGFAGAALARGAGAVAIVDTNDPALVLAWARGLPVCPILCDDNRTPISYLPLARFLVSRLPPLAPAPEH
ncbi:MAG TPA: phosphatase [Actinomycetota bacterium]|nr:phosphatase [Actinomycetota bacterium]